jgi:AcrR family transcriptional regulator
MSNRRRSLDTRARILEAARELFNERGATRVTTHHIAAACGISPGNLYYHFKNKEEIIRALFAASLDENEAFRSGPERGGADAASLGLAFAKEISWRYRFFKRELPALLQRDPALATAFREFHRRHLTDLQRDLEHSTVAGGGLPREEAKWLAEVSWLMVLFWPSFVEAGGAKATRREMDRGIEMIAWFIHRMTGGTGGAP